MGTIIGGLRLIFNYFLEGCGHNSSQHNQILAKRVQNKRSWTKIQKKNTNQYLFKKLTN